MKSKFDDICISRHRDNAASNEANASVRPFKEDVRARILAIAEEMGTFTSKDIARRLGKNINAVSGRLSELIAEKKIRPTAYRRERCAILEIVRTSGQPRLF